MSAERPRTCVARAVGAEAAIVKPAVVEAAKVAAAVLAARTCRPGAVVAVGAQRRATAAGEAQVRPQEQARQALDLRSGSRSMEPQHAWHGKCPSRASGALAYQGR